MTDRLKGFVVTFDQDIREDDAESLRQAILMMKNVISVEPVKTNFEDYMNREVIRRELVGDILELVNKKTRG